jgi:hypothetical protein
VRTVRRDQPETWVSAGRVAPASFFNQ